MKELSEFKRKKLKERELIIETGGDLFLTLGFQNFSIKILTEKLKMPKSNFYTHFASKRELFYAFKVKEYELFYIKFKEFIDSINGDFFEVAIRIAIFFIDYAAINFDRFQIIFATHAPASDKIGPIEEKFNATPNILIKTMAKIIENAIKNNEIKKIDPISCTYFLWGIIYGNIQTIDRIKSGRLGDHKAYREFAIHEFGSYVKTLRLE